MIYKDGKKILTNLDNELIHLELKEKNNIDDDFNMHVTPKMQQIFADNNAVQPMDIFYRKDLLNFEVVGTTGCPMRTITAEEYEAMPNKYKNKSKIIPNALLHNLIFLIVFMAFLFLLIGCIVANRNNTDGSTTEAIKIMGLATGFVGILFFVLFSMSLKTFKNKLITPDSKISAGEITLFYGKFATTTGSDYYVDITFYDDKKIIRKMPISETQLDQVSIGSKAIIHNLNVYVYNQNSKLISMYE